MLSDGSGVAEKSGADDEAMEDGVSVKSFPSHTAVSDALF